VVARYERLRAPGRNGIGAMTQILSRRLDMAHLPRSVLERRMLRLLDRARLPRPTVAHCVKLPGAIECELDFAYVDLGIGLEVDGHGSHATRRERAADNIRMNDLENAGWTIRRFTYEQVMHNPIAVASTVRLALANPKRRTL
jgi:Protein of unknown function (DUF559)